MPLIHASDYSSGSIRYFNDITRSWSCTFPFQSTQDTIVHATVNATSILLKRSMKEVMKEWKCRDRTQQHFFHLREESVNLQPCHFLLLWLRELSKLQLLRDIISKTFFYFFEQSPQASDRQLECRENRILYSFILIFETKDTKDCYPEIITLRLPLEAVFEGGRSFLYSIEKQSLFFPTIWPPFFTALSITIHR